MEQDIIYLFQNEFGSLLSPMETEIINDFRSQGFKDEQIREALKEAVFSGAVSFRYINKILKSWKPTQEVDTPPTADEQDLSWLE